MQKIVDVATVALLVRCILAFIFLFAGANKIFHTTAFADVIRAYQLVPEKSVLVLSLVLPWLELGVGLLFLVGAYLKQTSMVAIAMLVVFNAAVIIDYARGIDVPCGCFDLSDRSGITVWTVYRDISFLLMAIFVALFDRKSWGLKHAVMRLRKSSHSENRGEGRTR